MKSAADVLGNPLHRAEFDANPRQTNPIALPDPQPTVAPEQFNSRKSIRQQQGGVQWKHSFADGSVLRESQLMAYAGSRSVTQFQASATTAATRCTTARATATTGR